MSMYQIEDLVEYSIRQLLSASTDRQQLRSDIHYLYEFQNQFDCSFTNFRLLSGLLDCGYILLLDPQEHPLYATKREEFEQMMQRNFDYTPGPEGGYWCGTVENAENEKVTLNKMCCDYGSPLWQQLVSKDRLSGEAATPLSPLNPYKLVLRIIRGLSPEEDPYLFTNWYSFFPMLLQMDVRQAEATEEVKNELRRLLCQPLVFLALEQDTFLAPEEEYMEEDGPANEWFTPYFKWQKTKDRDPETLFYRMVSAFNRGQYSEAQQLARQGISLDHDNGGFYYYWACTVVIIHNNETEPFDSSKHENAITILRYTLPQYTEPHEQQGVQFYLALALLRTGRLAEAEEAARAAALLMEQDPQLSDYYRQAQQKWHK